MQMRNIRRASKNSRRTKEIERLHVSGQKKSGSVTGFTTRRHFSIDLSLPSLLDGSSGIGFPEHVIFQVTTDDGGVYESDETNAPQTISKDYVAKRIPASVYVDGEESYVDIEGLPPFDPMEAIRKAFDKE